MKKYTTKELNKKVQEYILNCISAEGYEDALGCQLELGDTTSQLEFLYNTFISEYGWAVERYGSTAKAFEQWIMGLPTCFGIEFTNHDILVLAESWGVIDETSTEAYKDKIIANYFNFITVKTFQMFRKHKIIR